ncbi:MAG: site-2 protease family protein [Fluviicola sp.]|jgi:stage IV sporulation protein FB
MENNSDSIYPPKPFLEKEEEKKGYIAVTVFSLLLFVLAFLLIMPDQKVFLSQLMIVLIVHELGHFLLMKLFHYKNVRMLFIPLMGAFVHGHKDEFKQSESLLVILAGPIPGIIFGVLSFLLFFGTNAYLRDLGFLSIIVNAINLIPILPLDGGRLVKIIWPGKAELFQLIVLLIASLGILFVSFWLQRYFLALIGVFMGLQLRTLHRRYLIHKEVREHEVVYQSTYEALSDRSYHFLKKKVLEHTAALRKMVSMDTGGIDVDMNLMIAEEVKNVLETPMKKNVPLWIRIFIVLLWLGSILVPVWIIFNYNQN